MENLAQISLDEHGTVLAPSVEFPILYNLLTAPKDLKCRGRNETYKTNSFRNEGADSSSSSLGGRERKYNAYLRSSSPEWEQIMSSDCEDGDCEDESQPSSTTKGFQMTRRKGGGSSHRGKSKLLRKRLLMRSRSSAGPVEKLRSILTSSRKGMPKRDASPTRSYRHPVRIRDMDENDSYMLNSTLNGRNFCASRTHHRMNTLEHKVKPWRVEHRREKGMDVFSRKKWRLSCNEESEELRHNEKTAHVGRDTVVNVNSSCSERLKTEEGTFDDLRPSDSSSSSNFSNCTILSQLLSSENVDNRDLISPYLVEMLCQRGPVDNIGERGYKSRRNRGIPAQDLPCHVKSRISKDSSLDESSSCVDSTNNKHEEIMKILRRRPILSAPEISYQLLERAGRGRSETRELQENIYSGDYEGISTLEPTSSSCNSGASSENESMDVDEGGGERAVVGTGYSSCEDVDDSASSSHQSSRSSSPDVAKVEGKCDEDAKDVSVDDASSGAVDDEEPLRLSIRRKETEIVAFNYKDRKLFPCNVYGCRQMYSSLDQLLQHLEGHEENPAWSQIEKIQIHFKY